MRCEAGPVDAQQGSSSAAPARLHYSSNCEQRLATAKECFAEQARAGTWKLPVMGLSALNAEFFNAQILSIYSNNALNAIKCA